MFIRHLCIGRPRFGSIPDERMPKPGRVSAYEQTLRNYAEKKSGVVINPAVGTSFDSRAEAYEFYNLYSWEVGFGIRWGRNRKNAAKSVTRQEIVCSCVVSCNSTYVFVSLYTYLEKLGYLSCHSWLRFRAIQRRPTVQLSELAARL